MSDEYYESIMESLLLIAKSTKKISDAEREERKFAIEKSDFSKYQANQDIGNSIDHLFHLLDKSDKYMKIYESKLEEFEPYIKSLYMAHLYMFSKSLRDMSKALSFSCILANYDPLRISRVAYCTEIYMKEYNINMDDVSFNFIKNGYEIGLKRGVGNSTWNLATLYYNHEKYKEALHIYEQYYKGVKSGKYHDNDHKLIQNMIKKCEKRSRERN